MIDSLAEALISIFLLSIVFTFSLPYVNYWLNIYAATFIYIFLVIFIFVISITFQIFKFSVKFLILISFFILFFINPLIAILICIPLFLFSFSIPGSQQVPNHQKIKEKHHFDHHSEFRMPFDDLKI